MSYSQSNFPCGCRITRCLLKVEDVERPIVNVSPCLKHAVRLQSELTALANSILAFKDLAEIVNTYKEQKEQSE